MRVLFVLTQDVESPSGAGRYLPLARELVRVGHEVTVAALHPGYDSLAAADTMIDGVKVCYVAPMHVRKSGSGKTYYSSLQLISVAGRATWSLSSAVWKTPVDIVHVGKPHPMNGLAGAVGKVLRGRYLFVDCDDDEAASSRFGSNWQRWGVKFFERSIPHLAHGVTTNTLYMQQRLVTWGIRPERVVYLPNGVEYGRFAEVRTEQLEALRAQLGLAGKQVVAFIGSLSLPSHPVDLLLEAFVRLLSWQSQAVLLVVGGGEDHDWLQRRAEILGIASSVRFCGRVPPSLVPVYYRLADVSVDPVHDNLAACGRAPLKLFESWAARVPFVSADVGDRRQLLGTPAAGLLVAPGSPEALAEGIHTVLADPALGQALRDLGEQRVKDYYWDRIVNRLDGAYQALEG